VHASGCLDHRCRIRGRYPHQRAQRVVASIETVNPGGLRECTLEDVVGGMCEKHDVWLGKVAAETRGPSFQVAERLTGGQLLEEVLDQVSSR